MSHRYQNADAVYNVNGSENYEAQQTEAVEFPSHVVYSPAAPALNMKTEGGVYHAL
jgi:hypothetical protein